MTTWLAGLAEDVIFHHVPHGGLGLVPGLGDDQHALAQRQTVGLDDGGDGGGVQIGEAPAAMSSKTSYRGGGDAVLFHEILGKDLAALNDGGLGVGGQSRGFQPLPARPRSPAPAGRRARPRRNLCLLLLAKAHNACQYPWRRWGRTPRPPAMPPLPGRAKISVTAGFFFRLLMMACSRPPPPTTTLSFHGSESTPPRQWWNSRMPVKAMTMPSLSHVLDDLIVPDGAAGLGDVA